MYGVFGSKREIQIESLTMQYIRKQVYLLDKVNTFQRLKASFHFTTGKICEERAKELHLEVDKKVIACISNLGLQQLKIFSSDLESFAR